MEIPPRSTQDGVSPLKDDSSFAPPSPEPPSPITQKSFFERASAIVSWLLGGARANNEAAHSLQITEEEKIKLQRIGELKKYSHEDVLLRARAVMKKLEMTKEALVEDFGEAALGFIFRHIDPVIHSTKTLLTSLEGVDEKRAEETKELSSSDQSRENTLSQLLEGAVDAVELYAIMNDEEHLKRRILHNIERHAYQAVIKDIQILKAYQTTASQELVVSHAQASHELVSLIQNDLSPIINQLEELIEEFPHSYDFGKLFEWRRIFDEKRNSLVCLATFLVDLHLMRYSFFAPYYGTHGAKESEGLAAERVIFVTDSQVGDSAALLNEFVEIEAIFIHLKKQLSKVQDSALEAQLQEAIREMYVLLTSFDSLAIVTAHDIKSFAARGEIIRSHLSQIALFKDLPII